MRFLVVWFPVIPCSLFELKIWMSNTFLDMRSYWNLKREQIIFMWRYMLTAWSEWQWNHRIVILGSATERKTTRRSLQGPQLLASHLETTEYREESISAPPIESLQVSKGVLRKTVKGRHQNWALKKYRYEDLWSFAYNLSEINAFGCIIQYSFIFTGNDTLE